MSDQHVDEDLIRRLRNYRAGTPQAVANDLHKFNQIVGVDCEMALVRARRALELVLRNVAAHGGIPAGTKPAEQLVGELSKAKLLPSVVERHCRVIKDFGNLAAHTVDVDDFSLAEGQLSAREAGLCVESLTVVVRWYINTIAPALPADVPYVALSGSSVTPDMVRQGTAIDSLVYPSDLRATQQVCLAWLDRNPDIYTILLDRSTNRVVGYINAMPLEEEYYRSIESGACLDVDFPPRAIRRYELPDFYLLYFCSIALHPSYHTTAAFKALYDAFIDKMLCLAEQEICFSEVLADAVSDEGVRLCRYAGMKEVRSTKHGSTIYKVTLLPPALRVTTSKGKSLVQFYQRKYEEFRDLLTSG